MKKQKKGRKFGRPQDQRSAMLRGLSADFLMKEKIKTTESKAKELRPLVEKFITKAKKGGDLSKKRYLLRFLPGKAVKKLTDQIAPRYKRRPGGYTRIVKLGPRRSDGARMAIIELV